MNEEEKKQHRELLAGLYTGLASTGDAKLTIVNSKDEVASLDMMEGFVLKTLLARFIGDQDPASYEFLSHNKAAAKLCSAMVGAWNEALESFMVDSSHHAGEYIKIHEAAKVKYGRRVEKDGVSAAEVQVPNVGNVIFAMISVFAQVLTTPPSRKDEKGNHFKYTCPPDMRGSVEPFLSAIHSASAELAGDVSAQKLRDVTTAVTSALLADETPDA